MEAVDHIQVVVEARVVLDNQVVEGVVPPVVVDVDRKVVELQDNVVAAEWDAAHETVAVVAAHNNLLSVAAGDSSHRDFETKLLHARCIPSKCNCKLP